MEHRGAVVARFHSVSFRSLFRWFMFSILRGSVSLWFGVESKQ